MTNHIQKTLFALASLLLVLGSFSCGSIPDSPERQSTIPYGIGPNSNFTIDNESIYQIGIVSIIGIQDTQKVHVDTTGIYTTAITFVPQSAVVNSIICPIGDTIIVPMGTGQVSVRWQDPNLIVIIDNLQQN
jgi:hypothetical protein